MKQVSKTEAEYLGELADLVEILKKNQNRDDLEESCLSLFERVLEYNKNKIPSKV